MSDFYSRAAEYLIPAAGWVTLAFFFLLYLRKKRPSLVSSMAFSILIPIAVEMYLLLFFVPTLTFWAFWEDPSVFTRSPYHVLAELLAYILMAGGMLFVPVTAFMVTASTAAWVSRRDRKSDPVFNTWSEIALLIYETAFVIAGSMLVMSAVYLLAVSYTLFPVLVALPEVVLRYFISLLIFPLLGFSPILVAYFRDRELLMQLNIKKLLIVGTALGVIAGVLSIFPLIDADFLKPSPWRYTSNIRE